MSARTWVIALTAIVIAGLGLFAPLAVAQEVSTGASGGSFVVLTGRLEVRPDDRIDDAVIFDGDATVDGDVAGTVTAFNGDITISGTVDGDVIALNGRVTLTDGASIGGDVVSSEDPDIAPGATVGGTVRRQPVNWDVEGFAIASRIAYWVAASVSSFILGLLLTLVWPRAADAVADSARRRVGPSIGWGALAFFGLPIAAVLLIVTLVGALLGVGVLLGLVLIYSIGYAAGALAFGRLLLKPPTKRFLAFLLGWGILRLVALIPVLGGLLFVATAVWGLGAVVVAAFRAARGAGPALPEAVVPPGAAPMPPMPSAP
jgi:hypothetical protein